MKTAKKSAMKSDANRRALLLGALIFENNITQSLSKNILIYIN